jgi:hypothetical protein
MSAAPKATSGRDGIVKTTITITVLHRADNPMTDRDINNQPASTDSLPAPWEDDPIYPMADWRYDVANGDELRGYRDWVAAQRELAALT